MSARDSTVGADDRVVVLRKLHKKTTKEEIKAFAAPFGPVVSINVWYGWGQVGTRDPCRSYATASWAYLLRSLIKLLSSSSSSSSRPSLSSRAPPPPSRSSQRVVTCRPRYAANRWWCARVLPRGPTSSTSRAPPTPNTCRRRLRGALPTCASWWRSRRFAPLQTGSAVGLGQLVPASAGHLLASVTNCHSQPLIPYVASRAQRADPRVHARARNVGEAARRCMLGVGHHWAVRARTGENARCSSMRWHL